MIKELKYLFFIMVIFFFLFFTLRYYFSDENNKKNYRSLNLLDKNIEKDLILLKNNTENIIENVEYNKDKKTKKYSFWELLYPDND